MSLFHSSSVTGNTLLCENPSSCSEVVHFSNAEAADAFFKRLIKDRVSKSSSSSSPSLDKILKESISSGFIKAEVNDSLGRRQIELLHDSKALSIVLDKYNKSVSNRERELLARVLSYGLSKSGGSKRVFSKDVEKFFREVEPERDKEVLLEEAVSLWHRRESPLHQRAKDLLVFQDLVISGYKKKDFCHVVKLDNSLVCESLGIDVNLLPVNVVAYDIETDTVDGLGLRPRRAQITEIVVSFHDYSWVLSGDEKKILQEFARLLSSQDRELVLIGWNNHCFDNVFLQTRAEFHQIVEWKGRLCQVSNFGEFEPCGVCSEAQSLEWVTDSGVVLRDLDLFQEKVKRDIVAGVKNTSGLKAFVKSLGCTPVEVDRHHIHLLSDRERSAYVLSDGLSTLRAYTEFQRQLW